MKSHIKHSENGFSILEAIIVIAILAILTTIALAQFNNTETLFKRENIAREFKVYLERCRFDSVRRRPNSNDYDNMSRVQINSETSYTVYYDINQDGVLAASEYRTIDFSNIPNVKLNIDGLTLPVVIRFDNRGLITTDANGYGVSSSFLFCTGACASSEVTPANGTIVSISPTGTVAMLQEGDSVVPLSKPVSNSTVSATDGVNEWVSAVATPIPSPTATATVAPTAVGTTVPTVAPTTVATVVPTVAPTTVATVVPTVAPTTVATPVATATPVVLDSCVRNQNVVTNPCNCDGGRRVNSSNNKCQ